MFVTIHEKESGEDAWWPNISERLKRAAGWSLGRGTRNGGHGGDSA